MLDSTPDRFRTLFVAVSATPKELAAWAVEVLHAKVHKTAATFELFPGEPDHVQVTLQPRKKPGDVVSQTILGAAAFCRNRRMPKPALAKVERLCQRLYDTVMTIACISDVELSQRATTALAQLAHRTGALMFDGERFLDELGRLVFDLKGHFDPAALAPQFAVVSSLHPIATPARQPNGVAVVAVGRKPDFHFAPAHERHLKYLGLKPRSREGQFRIKELAAFFKKAKACLYLERTDDDGDVIAAAKAITADHPAVFNDGWAFYGPDGKVLLDRNGELDPKAKWPLG